MLENAIPYDIEIYLNYNDFSSRGGLEVERLTMFTQVYALLRWIESRLG